MVFKTLTFFKNTITFEINVRSNKLKIPFVDIHAHRPRKSEEVITVQSLFLQDIYSNDQINIPFSAAIHPWHAADFKPSEVTAMLENLITQKKLFAVGETGLDKVCTADYQQQKRIFEIHIDFAETQHKPLIIHSVRSWNELISSLKRVKVPSILHGYSEGLPLTRQLIEMGCYFSLGKSALHPAPRFIEAIKIIPLTSLFLETDETGKPIEKIYQEISSILNHPLELLRNQIYSNFITLFSNDPS